MILTEPKTERQKGNSLLGNYDEYVIIDIETTGLDPQKDKIIELAGIKIKDNKVIKEYSSLINPEIEISSFITELTGIDNCMINKAPTIENELKKFIDFVGNDLVVGHNVNFDINFIYDNSLKYYNNIFENNYLDTLRMSRKLLSLENHKLKTLAETFNIDYKKAHRALRDCYITFDVYNKLKELNINNQENESHLLQEFVVPNENPFENKKIVVKGKIINYGYEFLCELARKCSVRLISDVFYRDCDYLILGINTYQRYMAGIDSEKLNKAHELEKNGTLKVLSEEDFYKLNGVPLKKKTKTFANKYEFPEEIDKNSQIYANEFVITGALEKLSRKDCTDIIIGLGGTVKDRISKSTNYLILGNNDYNPILNGEKSHKQKDAEKSKLNGQNIDIISENVFYDMIEDYIKIQ